MYWLKRKLNNWLNSGREGIGSSYGNEINMSPLTGSGSPLHSGHNRTTINIHRANGGYVVEMFGNRDSDKYSLTAKTITYSEPNVSLYIITDSEDFGTSLAHLITLENLK